MEDENYDLAALRMNADHLSKCLHTLLERIETLEAKSPRTGHSCKHDCDAHTKKDEKVVHEVQETMNTNSSNGSKKRTIVTERVLTRRLSHTLSLDPTQVMTSISNGRLLSPEYQARDICIDAKQMNQIEIKVISGKLLVTRVRTAANYDIRPGDTITHVNGRPAFDQKDVFDHGGKVTLTLVPAAIHDAPSIFYRINADYDSDQTDSQMCRWMPINVKKGDIVQTLSEDDKWVQVRKVNDLSCVGALPASLSKEKVAMLCPYGRRVLVLLGAVGVGRRTIKSMLLRSAPQYFATVVPMTSRQPRSSEQEGREYHFVRKEEMLQKIRDGGMVEWGEFDGQLYGTTADAVRSVIRSGRMCVLDCAPQALSYLYNSEFMPFVVHIVAPQFDELLQLENLRHHRRPVDQLSKVCAESDQISNGPHANKIHLTLVNRNLDVTFKRLTDALELLRNDTQWVPESWMC